MSTFSNIIHKGMYAVYACRYLLVCVCKSVLLCYVCFENLSWIVIIVHDNISCLCALFARYAWKCYYCVEWNGSNWPGPVLAYFVSMPAISHILVWLCSYFLIFYTCCYPTFVSKCYCGMNSDVTSYYDHMMLYRSTAYRDVFIAAISMCRFRFPVQILSFMTKPHVRLKYILLYCIIAASHIAIYLWNPM